MVTKCTTSLLQKITVDKSLTTFALGITFYITYFWLTLYFRYLWAAIKERSVQNLFSSCQWMGLLFRSINPSMKFRGCVQRLLLALITRELFVVENIKSPRTVACTNMAYRTSTCGHFMYCDYLWCCSTSSLRWVKEREKANRFLPFYSNHLSEISWYKLKFALTMQHIANGYLFQGYQPTATVMPTFTQSNKQNVPCHGSCHLDTKMGHLIS